MQQSEVKAKKQLRWFLDFMNLSRDEVAEKDVFVLWMDVGERVYGEEGPLFIPDRSLLEWGKRRIELSEIQKLLGNLLTRILHPIRISSVLNKPKRRINPEIEKPRKSIFAEANSGRNSPILTHTFKINVQRVEEKLSLVFSKLQDKLVFHFITTLTCFPKNLIQRCQRQDCSGYFLKVLRRKSGFALNSVLG